MGLRGRVGVRYASRKQQSRFTRCEATGLLGLDHKGMEGRRRMSVQEEVRAEQEAEFEAMGANETVRELTRTLYANIDAMTDEQKRLLVAESLAKASQTVQQAGSNPTMAAGLLMLTNGLIAIAGYTTTVMAEAAGDTSTGDKKVDETLLLFRDLAKETAAGNMSPEQRRRAEELAERVQARIAQGEDVDEAIRAERAAQTEVPVAKTSGEGYGLYL